MAKSEETCGTIWNTCKGDGSGRETHEKPPYECVQSMIGNPYEFKLLTDHLCDMKLLHPQEVKRLQHFFCDKNGAKFPINFAQLEQLISIHAKS